jgi:hypothetical protein
VSLPLHVLVGLWGERGELLTEAEAHETIETLAQEHLIELSHAPQHTHSTPPPPPARPPPRAADADGGGMTQPSAPPEALGVPPLVMQSCAPLEGLGVPPLPVGCVAAGGQSVASGSSDGKAIELLAPMRLYLHCRSKEVRALRMSAHVLHARVLECIRQTSIGDEEGGPSSARHSYWSVSTFLHHLRDGGAHLRANTLSSVTVLHLGGLPGGVPMGDAGAGVLGTALARRVLQCLTELHLQRNEIGDVGLYHLAQAAGAGALSKLATLVLAQNAFGDEGFAALAARMSSHLKAISTLDVSRNEVSGEGVSALVATIGKGGLRACSVIDLSGNSIGDASVSKLAAALTQPVGGSTPRNHTISGGSTPRLSEPGTPLTSRAYALPHPTAPASRQPLPLLAALSLADNPFGEAGLAALAKACAEGPLRSSVLSLSPLARRRFDELLLPDQPSQEAELPPPAGLPPPVELPPPAELPPPVATEHAAAGGVVGAQFRPASPVDGVVRRLRRSKLRSSGNLDRHASSRGSTSAS